MDNAPAGTPTNEEINNWNKLWNVQKLDISKIVKPFDLDKIMVSLTLLFPCPLDKIGQEYNWTVMTNKNEV